MCKVTRALVYNLQCISSAIYLTLLSVCQCVRVCVWVFTIFTWAISAFIIIFVFSFSLFATILFIIYIWLNYSQFSQLDFIQFQSYKITMRSQYLMYKLWFTIHSVKKKVWTSFHFVCLFMYQISWFFSIFFLNLSAVSRTTCALFFQSFLLTLNFLNWEEKSCKHWTGQCQTKFNTSVCLTPVTVVFCFSWDLRHFLVFCLRKILNASRKPQAKFNEKPTENCVCVCVWVSHNKIFKMLLYWFSLTPHYLLLIKLLAP